MKITRTSGLPVEPTDLPKYQSDLEAGLEEIKKQFDKPFDKLSQTDQAKFGKLFSDMKESIREKYEFESEIDIDTVLSKTKLKELVNRYGIIAFARGRDDKHLQCFIIDR